MNQRRSRPAVILLVEDSTADARITEIALKQSHVTNDLHVVTDGPAALAFLRRQPPHDDAPRPDLILLDLNLPGIDGREVLAEVKADPELRRIPVVVLTASADPEDVRAAYDTHANSYITKPVQIEDFLRVIRQLDEFFLTIVRLSDS